MNKLLNFIYIFLLITKGLAAQSAIQGAARPLRSINPDSPVPSPYSLFPIPHSPFILESLDQPLTVHYINHYSSPSGIKWLNSVINNSKIYLPYIKNEVAKLELPTELSYLPFIESGFIGNAKSRSGAVGYWQFMANSISPFDLKVNDMIDERSCIIKSTAAALLKLKDNYKALENWPMALAAYNAGLGGIKLIAKQAKSNDYWNLCEKKLLKNETIHYVPKLAAVSYILSRPRQFGLDYWPETLEWTSIKLPRQISLDLLAAETGIDRNILHLLNMELKHGITPNDKNYELKVPLEQVNNILEKLENKETVLLKYYLYQIKQGDTIFSISKHYGISGEMIEQYNPGILNRYLKIGEIINVPAFNEISPMQTVKDARLFNGTHVVKEGETLWSLGKLYKVDLESLAEENNIQINQILSVGKILKVPIIE